MGLTSSGRVTIASTVTAPPPSRPTHSVPALLRGSCGAPGWDPAVPGIDGARRAEFGIAALCALADAWSCWYRAQGVRPRDRVALYLEDSFEEHAHLAALAQLGAIAVVVNGRLPAEVALGLV